jgi:hypothetical protein
MLVTESVQKVQCNTYGKDSGTNSTHCSLELELAVIRSRSTPVYQSASVREAEGVVLL